MSLVQFQNSEVSALNGQSEYNSNAGSFNLQFEISGGANMALDLNSLRLICNVDYLRGSGAGVQHVNNNNVYGLGVRPAGAVAGAAPTGVSPAFDNTKQTFVDVDNRSGCNNVINSILWEDASNNTLEAVHSFPALANKVVSLTMSPDDCLTWGGSTYGIKSGAKSLQNQQSLNATNDLGMRLYTGLAQSGPLPYALAQGKIKLTIQLNSSSAVLFGGENYGANVGLGTDYASTNGGAYYRMSNVKLVYRNLIFDDETAPIMTQGYSYRHLSSLQSTISASNNTNIYNPNATNAISIMTSFIPSENLNNYQRNSVQSGKLKNGAPNGAVWPENRPQSVQINETNFLKNNINHPLTYPIDESIYTQNNNGNNNYDSQRSYYYMSCLKPINMLNNTLLQSSTEAYGPFKEWQDPDFNVPVSSGVGVRYANVSPDEGSDFTNSQSFQQRIKSGLNSSLNNEMFSSVLSTKRIVPSASGPVVLS